MIFTDAERTLAQAIADISFANPFLPKRVELEKAALGNQFDPSTRPFWSWSMNDELDRPNVVKLTTAVISLTEQIRTKLLTATQASDDELRLYSDLVWYVLYYEHFSKPTNQTQQTADETSAWDQFIVSVDYWMKFSDRTIPTHDEPEHIYACLYQVKRAFLNIFHCVIGRSWPICKLRANIWESIFTHDMRRSRRILYSSMNEVTTLVVGNTGTGKELVARAVGLSQYVPFDKNKKQFTDVESERFFPLNLSAFSPTLIESELFGHKKGSFTGAVAKRVGWLESAGRYGTVFLDEIGELDVSIQVKLLRVLQQRQFQPIGENKTLPFKGKFIGATNRNLADEIQKGTFREDFYYRLCSDIISTPTLIEQLLDRPSEFGFLVDFICRRIAPGDHEQIRESVEKWFESSELADYRWPGNMRELEQCVRNIMIHNHYAPPSKTILGASSEISKAMEEVTLTSEELLSEYCAKAYRKYGSYEKAAEVLGLDRRTVRAKANRIKVT
jgi:transcriptional regulator with AAA-type ATPase domain